MFSYVFMKILEGRPASYDRGMNAVSGGRVLEVKRAVAEEVPEGSAVLEIGCGTGELAEMLVARGCTVKGFDASRGMVEQARARIAAAGLEDRFTVRRMGVDGMDDLPDCSHDAAVSTLVFSELSDDERGYALRHAARILRPGGLLVVAAEVVPRTAVRRLVYGGARAAAQVATYLASGASTRPVADLTGEVTRAGFAVDQEERSHGDALALLVAHLPGPEGT